MKKESSSLHPYEYMYRSARADHLRRDFFVILAAAVVFVTVYFLILPAITLDQSRAAETPGVVLTEDGTWMYTMETGSGTDTGMSPEPGDSWQDPYEAEPWPDEGFEEDGEWLSFDTDNLSGFIVMLRTIEKTFLASDGYNYRIRVDYPDEALIPAEAALAVEELQGEAYEEYLGRTAVAMDAAGFSYARIFDISILGPDGEKVQPEAPVTVSVELLDGDSEAGDFSVVHFEGEEEEPQEMTAETDGNVVSFSAEGFSAYAIVQGPSEIPAGLTRISTLEQLKEAASGGVFIGTTGGYYLQNTTAIGSQDKNTTGILKTVPAQSFPPTGTASRYYFEAADGTGNRFYAWCEDGEGNRLYVRNTGNANLTLTAREGEKTAFTILVDNSGRFRFQNGSRYWNMWNGAGGNHIACWTSATDSNNYFYVWQQDEDYAGDPFGMDGVTCGLMNWAGGPSGRALMAHSGTENSLEGLVLTVMARAGKNEDRLFVPENSDITLWTFRHVQDDRYYVSAVTDGVRRYLQIRDDGLSWRQSRMPPVSFRLSRAPGHMQAKSV